MACHDFFLIFAIFRDKTNLVSFFLQFPYFCMEIGVKVNILLDECCFFNVSL